MKNTLIIALTILIPSSALAWGKRGHQTVCETAALLVAQEPKAEFLKARSFDFGYYCNVPDFIWKREKTYALERPQHYMDLDVFDAEFKKKPEIKNPFDLSRKDFEKAFPEINENMGRAFWRVRELNDKLTSITDQLKALPESKKKERQALQEKWLVLAGVMGHYIGDLSQPLHTTENHDGQSTGQKGVHTFYEEEVIDELYPKFRLDVHNQAMKRWPEFKKQNANKSITQLMEQLTRTSFKDIEPLLKKDKAGKREPIAKSAPQYQKLITKHLVEGALTLAEIYRRQTGFTFDNDKFYFFAGEPEYIMPGEAEEKKK